MLISLLLIELIIINIYWFFYWFYICLGESLFSLSHNINYGLQYLYENLILTHCFPFIGKHVIKKSNKK